MWSRRLVGSVEPTTPSAVWSRRLVGSVEPTTRRQCGADDPVGSVEPTTPSAVWSRRLVGSVEPTTPPAVWSRRLVGSVEPTTRRQCGADDSSVWRDGRRRRDGPARLPHRARVPAFADRRYPEPGVGRAPHHPAAFAHPAMPTGRRLHIPRIPPPSPIPPCRRVVGSSTFGAELISISRGSPAKALTDVEDVVVNGGGRIEGDFGQLELGHRLQLQPDCWQVGFRRTIRRRGDPHSGGEAIKVTSYRDTKKQAAP